MCIQWYIGGHLAIYTEDWSHRKRGYAHARFLWKTDVRGFEVGDCMKEYCSNGSNCRHELPQTL